MAVSESGVVVSHMRQIFWESTCEMADGVRVSLIWGSCSDVKLGFPWCLGL